MDLTVPGHDPDRAVRTDRDIHRGARERLPAFLPAEDLAGDADDERPPFRATAPRAAAPGTTFRPPGVDRKICLSRAPAGSVPIAQTLPSPADRDVAHQAGSGGPGGLLRGGGEAGHEREERRRTRSVDFARIVGR
jgi:hypothetical protein